MPSPRQILEGIIGFASKKEQERHKWGAVAGGVGGAVGGGMLGAYTGILHPQAQAAWMRSSMEGVTDSIHDAMGSIDESVGEGWKDPRAKPEPFGKGKFTEAEKKARLKAVKIARNNKQAIRRIGRNAAIGAAALGGIGALTGYSNSRAGNHPMQKNLSAREELEAIVRFDQKKEAEPETVAKMRIKGMVGGATIGAYAGALRGLETGSAVSGIEGAKKTVEKARDYMQEDAERAARKHAERYMEIEGPGGERMKVLKDRAPSPKIPFSDRLNGIKSGVGKAAREGAAKAKFAVEDTLHGAKKWVGRSSLSRSVAIGSLLGAGVGNYLGGKAGANLHRSRLESQKRMQENRVHKRAVEIAKAHVMARAIADSITQNRQLSARDELSRIINLSKKGGDYPRHWSQKKKGKPIGKKSTKKSRDDEENEQHQMSARDQLNTILFGADPRPRNSLGMFGSDEPGGPDPRAMSMTYGRAAGMGATAGAAGVAGGMGMKALLEKLKAMKKK